MTTSIVLGIALLLAPAAAGANEYVPALDRIRTGIQRQPVQPVGIRQALAGGDASPAASVRLRARQSEAVRHRKDGLIDGALIGMAAGAGAGYVWARNMCDHPDPECAAIVNPVGILTGAAAGSLIGALIDWGRR